MFACSNYYYCSILVLCVDTDECLASFQSQSHPAINMGGFGLAFGQTAVEHSQINHGSQDFSSHASVMTANSTSSFGSNPSFGSGADIDALERENRKLENQVDRKSAQVCIRYSMIDHLVYLLFIYAPINVFIYVVVVFAKAYDLLMVSLG